MTTQQSAYSVTNLTDYEIMKLERLDRYRQRQYEEYVRLLKEEEEEKKNGDARKESSKVKPPPHLQIQYSEKYYDDKYEYRHVRVPKAIYKHIPEGRLLSEYEWRSLGISMSVGWVNYATHEPNRDILLFRRPYTGKEPNPRLQLESHFQKVKEAYVSKHRQ